MSVEGSLEGRGLSDVLPELARDAQTGILTIQGNHEIIAFAFLKGGIVSADALNQTIEEGLGRVLADLGLVEPEQFAELAAEYQAGGGQVIDLLTERGFVERSELLEAVRLHTYRLCRQALEWTQGDYKFYQGDEVSYEEGVEPISPVELLVRASRDLGEALVPDGVPGDEVLFKRRRSASAPQEEAADGGFATVDEQVAAIYKLVNGKRSVGDLAEASGLPSYRVAFFLGRWESEGLLKRAGARAARPSDALESAELESSDQLAVEAPRERKPSKLARWWAGRGEGKAIDALPWPSRLLGLVFVGLFLWTLAAGPSRILLPFPWQRGIQDSLDRERSSAALARLRLANSTHFLLFGRFGEDLVDLTESGLLPAEGLAIAEGMDLTYSATGESYVVGSSRDGQIDEAFLQESVRGNFLLDPEIEPPAQSRRAPLVLLD